MLDHVTIGVSDFKRSRHFYDQALHPLEIVRLYADGENAAGFGIHPKAFFWISGRDAPQSGAHIAFAAKDHNTVERFYEAAIKAGGNRATTAAMANLAEAIQGLVAHMRTEQQMIREWADGQGEQNREIKKLLERIARQPENN